uniref:Biogenesis of lysosome-related organelles complex 1 subunit 3 n=1 Tax=Gasterosteus aculeatus aculeatus TaxID=481459 RepID=G3P091_GASAC
MSSGYQIVVQGEASETDSDDEVYITSMSPPQIAPVGAKVPGEASETDSEEEEAEGGQQADRASSLRQDSAHVLRRDLPPLIVVRDHPDIQSVVEDRPSPTHRPQGDTLLQQKLQESNSRLHSDVGQMVRQVYGTACKEITASKLGVLLTESQRLPWLKRGLVVQTLGVTAPPPGLEEQQQDQEEEVQHRDALKITDSGCVDDCDPASVQPSSGLLALRRHGLWREERRKSLSI